jgi:hypothetical protein
MSFLDSFPRFNRPPIGIALGRILASLLFLSGAIVQVAYGKYWKTEAYGALGLAFGYLAYRRQRPPHTVREFGLPVMFSGIGISFSLASFAPGRSGLILRRPDLLILGIIPIVVGVASAAIIIRLTGAARRLNPVVAAKATGLLRMRNKSYARATVVLRDGRKIANVPIYRGGFAGVPPRGRAFDARNVMALEAETDGPAA